MYAYILYVCVYNFFKKSLLEFKKFRSKMQWMPVTNSKQ